MARILVVEDDPIIRALVARSLEGLDYRVLTAIDGNEAQRVFDISLASISLVISDVVMPGLGGIELREWLQKTAPKNTRFLHQLAVGDPRGGPVDHFRILLQLADEELRRQRLAGQQVDDALRAVRRAQLGVVQGDVFDLLAAGQHQVGENRPGLET